MQPLYGLFAFLILARRGFILNAVNIAGVCLIALISTYAVGTILLRPESTLSILLNGASYLLPVVAMLAIRRTIERMKLRIFLIIIMSWLLIGLHQFLAPYNWFGDIMTALLFPLIGERFTMYRAVDGEGGRGSQFFTPEPASATGILLLFAFLTEYFLARGLLTKKTVVPLRIAIFLMVFINMSATAFIVMIPYLFFIAISTLRGLRLNCRAFINLVLSCLVILAAINFIGVSGRVFDVASWLFDNYDRIFSSVFLYVLSDQAGSRISNIIYSWGSLVNNYGLGHGVAGWNNYDTFLRVAERSQLWTLGFTDDAIIKPWSYASLVAFDIGWLGVIILAALIAMVLVTLPSISLVSFTFFASAIVLIIFVPPTSSPVPWVIFGLLGGLSPARRDRIDIKYYRGEASGRSISQEEAMLSTLGK